MRSYHPFCNQIDQSQRARVGELVDELKKYNYQLSNQVDEMELQVKAIQAKIKAVYADNSMEGMKYHLHSICVHDGTASQGHYYSYIYDRN